MTNISTPGEREPLALQCSNPACQTTFKSAVQHCLTCGALLRGMTLGGRFQIAALLGRGGMGAVYRAVDMALSRSVAIKVLMPGGGLAGGAPDELRARFFREARLAAQLDHPNIVPVLHFDLDGPLAYLVMPLLTGGTLGQRMRRSQAIDPATVSGWLRQMAAALDYAHQRAQPIVHRDVKPGNFLFHEDGRLCLADFGIARVVAGSDSNETAQLTRAGVVLGSLAYIAPEQVGGQAIPASDQYSVGVLLYELLTGTLPFEASDNYALIIQHASATPTAPSARVPGLAPGLDAVIFKALAKHPEDRFSSVGALAESFRLALASAPTAQLAQPPTLSARPSHPIGDISDPRGESYTEAVSLQQRSPVGPLTLSRAPGSQRINIAPTKPPTKQRRITPLRVALFGGLALLLCFLGLAGLSKLSQSAKTQSGATAQATATPKATPTEAQRQLAMLQAAEQNKPIFHDALHNNSRGWQILGMAQFQSDGLHLITNASTGSNAYAKNDTKTSFVRQSHLQLGANFAVTMDVSYKGANISYGFGSFWLFVPGYAFTLDSKGDYTITTISVDLKATTLAAGFDNRLALRPGTVYHFAALVQGGQVAYFLNNQWITSVSYAPSFPGATTFTLSNFGTTEKSGAEVIVSDLVLYPA